jgi:ankyrin repeat protein
MRKSISLIFVLIFMLSQHTSGDLVHQYSKEGNLEKIKLLWDTDPEIIRSKDQYGWTPLHYSAVFCHYELGEFLIQKEVDIDATDVYGLTALDLAGLSRCNGLVVLLLQQGAMVNPKAEAMLSSLPYMGFRKELIDLFAKNGIDLRPKNTSVDSTTIEKTIMRLPTNSKDIPTLESLANSHTFNVGTNSLHKAVINNDLDTVKSLIISNRKLVNKGDDHGITPLHYAAVKGLSKILIYLISKGARVNRRTKTGITPLYGAVSAGQIETVGLLIIYGAKINSIAKEGATPMHAVTDVSVAKLLHKHGAKINKKNLYGYTPLHSAAYGGYTEVVKFLISKGAYIDAQSNFGWTPLMEAIYNRRTEVVDVLLNNGANVHAKTHSGSTPLMIAEKLRYPEIAELLMKSVDKF